MKEMLTSKASIVLAIIIGYVSIMNCQETVIVQETVPVVSSTEELLIVGIPFDCSGKPTGFYKDTKFCDIFHVCVNFQQRKTYGCPQLGDQFFYDESLKMCEFRARNPNGCPSNTYYQQVKPTEHTTLIPESMTTEPLEKWKEFIRKTDSFSCLGKGDGFYPSRWCNVFYRCANGVRFEFLCAKQRNGERLWWTEHSTTQSQGLEAAECAFPCDIKRECTSPGGLLIEDDNGTVIMESAGEVSRIMDKCNSLEVVKPSVDHNDDIFRLPSADQSATSCVGQPDGVFQGSDKYCNVFHVCYAGTKRDFLCAKALNSEYELWWDETKNRCDWPCKVKCNKQVFGGTKSASEIQRFDNVINAADCQVTVKSYKYTFLNRYFKK